MLALHLQLQAVCDEGDEFRIRGFSLGIADGIAEKSLQGIQITSVPGDFDGVTDGSLHTAGGGLECLGYLRIQDFRDGIRVPDGPRSGFQESVICRCIDWFLSCPLHYWFVGLFIMITKSNFIVKFEGNKHLKKVFSK